MRKLFTLCLLLFSLSASAQWQQTGSKVRYVNGLGIPTKDTAAGVLADSSQILIRPADSSLYVKYKRTWLRVGGGGGSIAGSGTTNYIPKFTSASAIGNSQIFDDGTNVGIGTASPSEKLHLTGNTFRQNDASNSFGYTISTTSATTTLATLFGGSSFGIRTGGSGSDNMRITSAGNVGIGTTSPDAKLRVAGAANSTQAIFGNVDGRGLLIGTSIISGTNDAGSILNARGASSGTLILQTDGTERMRITSGGNTLIGTTTDNGTDRLQVSGSATVSTLLGVGTSASAGTVHVKTTSPSIVIDDNDNNGTAAIRFRPQSSSFSTKGAIELVSTGSAAPTRFQISSTDTMTFRTNSVERVRVTSGTGAVLISTTSDNGIDKLQVNGSIDAKGFAQAYTAKGATYTAATSDYLIDCTSGTFTVNLPSALLNVGRILIIKNSGTGTVTVDGFSSQTIDGATTYSLATQYATVQLMCDGNNWKIISKF